MGLKEEDVLKNKKIPILRDLLDVKIVKTGKDAKGRYCVGETFGSTRTRFKARIPLTFHGVRVEKGKNAVFNISHREPRLYQINKASPLRV